MKYSIIPFNFFRLILPCLLLISFSCSHKKKEDKELWIGKKLSIPEVISHDKKIVVRFMGDCPSCIASIKNLRKFYKVAKAKNKNVKFVFYVEIVSEEIFNEVRQKLDFADYIIFDQRRAFFNKNLLKFPYDLEYQTFLLNEENEILLFGNPVVKNELIRKYIEKL